MKRVYLLVLILFQLKHNAYGETALSILVQARNASPVGFATYMLSHDQTTSYSQWNFENYLSPERVKLFAEEIQIALQQITQAPLARNRPSYQKILLKAQKSNWPIKIRKEVARLWLHIYQLETNQREKSHIIRQLADFSPEFNPQSPEFSSPTIAAWKNELSSKPTFAWLPDSQWDDFDFLIINGKFVNLSKRETISLSDRPIRMTGFSNVFIAFDQIVPARDLIWNYSPPKEYLVSGECGFPLYHTQLQADPIKAYFNDNCVESRTTAEKKKEIQWPNLEISNSNKVNNSTGWLNLPKWTWIALGGFAALYVGHLAYKAQISNSDKTQSSEQNQSPSNGSQPITHQGF